MTLVYQRNQVVDMNGGCIEDYHTFVKGIFSIKYCIKDGINSSDISANIYIGNTLVYELDENLAGLSLMTLAMFLSAYNEKSKESDYYA